MPALFIAGFGLGAFLVLSWSLNQAAKRRRARTGPSFRWTRANIISGLAAVAIIASTVMAFLFEDVSILLALLLMRLGVLILAPVIDLCSGRRPTRAGLLAAGICGTGCAFGSITGTFSPLSVGVMAVLSVYFAGYVIRLSLMTKHAKIPVRSTRGDWFIAEVKISAIALICFAGLSFARQLVFDYQAVFIEWRTIGVAISCGLAYGYAFVNGTLIYLDWRENVRAVTINRSASLLAGVAASLIGWAFLDMPIPDLREWGLALFMALALLIMGAESLGRLRRMTAK